MRSYKPETIHVQLENVAIANMFSALAYKLVDSAMAKKENTAFKFNLYSNKTKMGLTFT